ncbi:Peptidyl-prolyl cis-trans isomerase CWC27-like protein [Cryptotermes secundus]|uniref:Spliceosome-associated protein CWC27 homolog n=1 Tax=Cryptotermes secundus TaxID=105785 RepID=A0A2J7PD97_9NEOP|nr:spliceosome-associated protein CWC27 homolog isoform X2 [Cryptotermes secundus]PNF14301.1 Peptidyl-prolyl cis-trans isomerase CWC27-like protein [Cryptotermes secundus]PNF14302.1 Peptidyl-prolyl cis-trans isomerase CWC27-like protein [Cryptotermes secundus]
MSNIYIQEPPTNGKVLLKTTVGDIELELWSKETPKACRNFVQLCMEGYYNGTLFHRVVKGFIVQGGDPTGTGTGGESVYGHPFKDEFHSRLRFNRRGLLAMANAGQDDNASQFFFTLGPTPELQNKHTIFGKVTGETIFNMLKLEDVLVDKEEKPLYPQKIIKVEILYNPFPDIVPRTRPEAREDKVGKSKKEKKAGVKNFKLLSFGEEAEEDEEESSVASRKYSGRSKSTHDILNDPCLSAVPAVETAEKMKEGYKRELDLSDSDLALSGDEAMLAGSNGTHRESDEVSKIKKKLKTDRDTGLQPSVSKKSQDEEREKEVSEGNKGHSEMRRRADDIRKEIRDLKQEIQNDKKKKQEKEKKEQEEKMAQRNVVARNETIEAYKQVQEKYKQLKSQISKKGPAREDFTLALMAKFQRKLSSARESAEEKSGDKANQPSPNSEDKTKDEDDDWLTHKLSFEANAPVLAKDASTKTDDWFEIYDPRNPINKRRREASKDIMKTREKH